MKDTSFVHGRYRLDWIYIGEGRDGEYDCTDPDDKPLLRANLYGDDEMLDNGSYCTGAHLHTPVEDLEAMSNDLFRDLPSDPAHFRKRVMELWTWNTGFATDDLDGIVAEVKRLTGGAA